MSNIVESFKRINSNIINLKPKKPVNIVAISKTFPIDHIRPLINLGHNHFGENKVQEAVIKWKQVKSENRSIKLHMVGKLQSNKAKNAVEIFDYIHSLDNQKLADLLHKNEKNLGKKLKYFIQVNIGNELQKSGIPTSEVENFYDYCSKEKNLDIIGLMIIPPNDQNSKKYFQSLSNLGKTLGLSDLSMGMSSDYLEAVKSNATFIRVGSLIFGKRG